MKQTYAIQFPEGPRTFTLRSSFITNQQRADYMKIDGIENIASDMTVLNAVMAIIVTPPDDFTTASAIDTQAVLTDFFESFTPKTNG